MARPARKRLSIVPIGNGRWLLHGWIGKVQTRKRSRDYGVLEAERARLEEQIAKETKVEPRPRVYSDRLTWDHARDAEKAVLLVPEGRTLLECVVAGIPLLPPVAGVSCADTLTEWLASMNKRRRSARTEEKNKLRITAFLNECGAKKVTDVRPLMIEGYVLRAGRADYTRITDAQVIRAWLNFCVRRRWLAVSPFEIDMRDLSATARTKEPARILAPEQCRALLRAAQTTADGIMVPYVILATWCFMSPQEIIRTTRAKMKLDGASPVVEVDTVKRRTAKFRSVAVPRNVLPLLRDAVKDWPDAQGTNQSGKPPAAPCTVPFVRHAWDVIREKAGILQRNAVRNKRRSHRDSVWQGSILRHTGISYLFQLLSERATRGKFNEKSVIAEVCRQAGNTSDTSFRHYLNLPAEGAAGLFYAPISSVAGKPQ